MYCAFRISVSGSCVKDSVALRIWPAIIWEIGSEGAQFLLCGVRAYLLPLGGIRSDGLAAQCNRQFHPAGERQSILPTYSTTSGIPNSTIFPEKYSIFSDDDGVSFPGLTLFGSDGYRIRRNAAKGTDCLGKNLPFRPGSPDADSAVGISRNQKLSFFHCLFFRTLDAALIHRDGFDDAVPLGDDITDSVLR